MRQLLVVAIFALTVYGIVDCAQSDRATRRNIPLWVWVAIMLLLPGVGALIWLITSRMIEPTPPAPPSKPVAPDDDPEFLRYLERRNRRTGDGPSGSTQGQDGPGQ